MSKSSLRRLITRFMFIMLGVLLAYEGWIFARVWWWVDHNPRMTAFMQDRLEILRETRPNARLIHQWVPYDRISRNLKKAVIASEDAKFRDHEGFDWEGIQEAWDKNLERGHVVAGGSTISQQLAKNLFLSGSRNPLRKAQEAIITVMLETMMDKRRILEIYLNVAEWGNGIFGAEAAARHYFRAPASTLAPEQAARLAAMLPRPRYYDTHRNSRALARKTQILLERMPGAAVPQ